jgi:molybdenum cofactor cytidylyltransferase
MNMHPIGIILLAAGGSARMGRPKQLLSFGKTTLLRHAAETALASGLSPVVVVLGAEAESCRAELEGLPVAVARNEDWSRGMGDSLRAGVEELERIAPDIGAALVMLHDQPRISAAALRDLANLWSPEGCTIAAAFYGGTSGVPAVFGRNHFAELKTLDGGGGAKGILARHDADVAKLELPEALDDIDSPEDYARLSRADQKTVKPFVQSGAS